MASTYVNNLRLNEMATGDASGTWGTITNTNLELIGEALGFGTEAITTNADTHTTTVADGASDGGRAMYLKYTGTLDSACTITIAPNTMKRMQFIENGTSGSQNIIISQGSGANITIPPGDTKAVYLDGAGSGAAVVDAFASLNVVDLKVEDDLTVTDDLIVNGDIDLEGSIDVNGTANLDVVDIDGAVDMASTLGVTGVVTANAGVVVDNITIDGTEIDLSSGDLTLDVAGNILLNADGGGVYFQDASVLVGSIQNSSSDLVITSEVQDKDILFKGDDGGSAITALTLDMSAAGSATFGSHVSLADSNEIKLGAGVDLKVFSDGTNGVLRADNGRVYIQTDTGVNLTKTGNAETMLIATPDGAVELYHDNSKKFETTSGGFQSVGAGSVSVNLGSTNAGGVQIVLDGDSNGDFSGSDYSYIRHETDGRIDFVQDSPSGTNEIRFYTETVERFRLKNSEVVVNEAGHNVDFRVESDSNSSMIFVEGDTSKVMFRKTNADDTVEGTTIFNRLNQTTDADVPLLLNRGTNDGTLVLLRQNNSTEGEIVVSGTTVSYNGGHISRYSQLADSSRDNTIVKGTVMTNLDQMAEWKHEDVLWTEDDKLPVYTEDDTIPDGKSVGDAKVSVGDVRTPAYTEDNEQLNCMAVSSVEGDANVAGVLVNWDNDDKEHTGDMNIAMTGDMVIRIGKDTTVSRGDLLMSAGDGTAKPQGEDIVRSKTVAKVTSTNKSHTYDDGTYLVPCVLMAC
jgi:hypothetical protein